MQDFSWDLLPCDSSRSCSGSFNKVKEEKPRVGFQDLSLLNRGNFPLGDLSLFWLNFQILWCPEMVKITIANTYIMPLGFPGGSDGNESSCNVGDLGLIPGLGRSPGEGHGNPLQNSCLENPHGQKNLAGYSPWGCKESGTTKRLRTHN